MHGKAQREPARHSVVLDYCKLVALHNTCQSLPAVCYIRSMQSGGQCLPMRKFRGGQKLANRSQPFLDQSSPISGYVGESLQINKFLSGCWYPVPLQRKIWSTFKVGPKKRFFCPKPVGVNAPESSDQIFQIAVISEYVSKFGWDPYSDLSD